MELEITTYYCLCEELLTALNIKENSQVKTNNAEVMTVLLTAACFFHGNIRNALIFLKEHGYTPDMISESRLDRRLHAIDDFVWLSLFFILSKTFKDRNKSEEYIVDSFPVPVCDNIRISRSKIFKTERYRGYIACKRRFFYGIRVHMIVTADKEPVEFQFAPGADADVAVFKQLDFDLPPGSVCHGDKAYNDYNFEDMLKLAADITFKPIRKKNSLRAIDPAEVRRTERRTRKKIETGFSMITNLFPKKIHAVTQKGFALKVMSFILVFAIRFL